VGGGDYVDVMAADLLERDHHFRQVFILNFLSSSLMGDGPVLAEDTAEIAVGEEDGARPILTHQGYLFAKMGLSAENHDSGWGPAETSFALLPIHPTLPGTEFALLKDGVGLLDPLSQFTLTLQFLIGRMPSLSLFLFGMKGDRREKQRATQDERTFDEIPARDLRIRHSITSKAIGPFFHA